MGLGFVVTGVTMWLGLWVGLPAIPIASIALSTGTGIELFYLWQASRRMQATFDQMWLLAPAAGD
jgi:hypothetical protein